MGGRSILDSTYKNWRKKKPDKQKKHILVSDFYFYLKKKKKKGNSRPATVSHQMFAKKAIVIANMSEAFWEDAVRRLPHCNV